jgi:hypothetical protein
MISALAYLRRRFTRQTSLFVIAPRLEAMTARFYEDCGQQLQLYPIGGSDVPDCMTSFPRGKYVFLVHRNQDPDDEEYSKEVFLIGLDYQGAYRKRLDLVLSPLDDQTGWRVRLCADGHFPFIDREVPFTEATEEHPCILHV